MGRSEFKKSKKDKKSRSRSKSRGKSRSKSRKSEKIKQEKVKYESPEINYKKKIPRNDNYNPSGFKQIDSGNVEIFGYSNDNNPFLDPNLHDKFVWKKNKKQVFKSTDERREELESIQIRIQEHERIKEERMLEQDLIQRAKEAENYMNRKSDSHFDIEQAKSRSKIRISNGRAKPIDLLIEYVCEEENLNNSKADVINHEPTDFISGLNQADLEDLRVDIKNYYRNMEPGKNTQYWEDVLAITEEEIEKLNPPRQTSMSEEDKDEIFKEIYESPIEEAENLITSAKAVIEIGDTKHTDLEFYEHFVNKSRVIVARRRLHHRHFVNLQANLNRLKMEQGMAVDALFPSAMVTPKTIKQETSVKADNSDVKDVNKREPYDSRSYSPVLIRFENTDEEVGIDDVVYNGIEDFDKLDYLRKQYLKSGSLEMDTDGELMMRVANNEETSDILGLSSSNGDLVEQVAIAPQSFLWSDKYRPRRPRFYNKVNTGFDWNKYNQTHYDIDNPPPKVVQGYRFNILYTDLIDKTKTPTFDLSPSPDDDSYAILTFKAGPPYEDIAFKIVNREWETSERHGYKCQFYRDVLQLHFHFKRYRYRK